MSCQDVASILWGFYPTLGCHDTQNALHKYNHPTEPIRLICIDGLTKPLFLGRLRHERLTSNQIVGPHFLCQVNIPLCIMKTFPCNIHDLQRKFFQKQKLKISLEKLPCFCSKHRMCEAVLMSTHILCFGAKIGIPL